MFLFVLVFLSLFLSSSWIIIYSAERIRCRFPATETDSMFLLKIVSSVLAVSSSVIALNIPNHGAHHGSRDVTFKSSVYEKLTGPPKGWVRDDATSFDKDVSMVKLTIQLVPQNMDEFHELALNVCLLLFFIIFILLLGTEWL